MLVSDAFPEGYINWKRNLSDSETKENLFKGKVRYMIDIYIYNYI